MKFLERFTLIIYSLIMLIVSVIVSLLIFNWMDFDTVVAMVDALLTGELSSKITLGVAVVFILLSIKCLFFDERSKEVIKESQGILLKNENGQLMISRETIDNMVKHAVTGFENVKECNTKIDVNIIVEYGSRIPDVAFEIQNRVKKSVENMTGLKVAEVNVHVQGVKTEREDREEQEETEQEDKE